MREAGFWVRFGASLLDGIIVSIPLAIIVGVLTENFDNDEPLAKLLSGLYSILLPVLWSGRTIGKRICGIRIRKYDTHEPLELEPCSCELLLQDWYMESHLALVSLRVSSWLLYEKTNVQYMILSQVPKLSGTKNEKVSPGVIYSLYSNSLIFTHVIDYEQCSWSVFLCCQKYSHKPAPTLQFKALQMII